MSQKWKATNSSGKENKPRASSPLYPGLSKRGRRLAWTRIHAWGACDPGFKSQRPHHDNSGPILGLHYFLLLKILTSPNSQMYSKPASISFWASSTVFGCGMIIVVLEADELRVEERVLDVSVAEHFHGV